VSRRVVVIGGGVGTLIASELARHGLETVLVDERPRLLAGASGRHGRRLHLGEHYSGDAEFAPGRLNTGQTCLLGALALVGRWPHVAGGPGRWWQFIVEGSMTSPEAYDSYLRELRRFHWHVRAEGLDPDAAFGSPDDRHRTLARAEYAPFVESGLVELGVESREPVIDAARLHTTLVAALRDAGVELLTRHRVLAVSGTEGDYALTLDGPDGRRELRAAYVVNAAWHELARLTTTLGDAPFPVSTRLRVMAEVALPVRLHTVPSMYFHRGVLGNHTNIGRGRALLLAEDVCNLATAEGAALPDAWGAFVDDRQESAWLPLFRQLAEHEPARVAAEARRLAGEVVADRAGGRDGGWLRRELGRAIMRSYRRWVPAVEEDAVLRLIPNVVVSAGDVDLHDPDSAVHRRDAIVREARAGYVEVLTGKLTYFVLVAEEATARVLARARGVALAEARQETMAPVVRRAWEQGALAA
jgi:FAD dependent oxidoreductase